ncbi:MULTISPECIES: glutamate 5-kinase [Shewanella]|uniref:Glutamate 5-kinase n=1 Tax=Shewanella marisflavi TaxID=260364 RepID=A0AAC9TWZ5_9GAMM|nr:MULTISPECIES: glutamate 5-kinase [Shewanella]ASJ95855.1 glutamate 5-kinase [Shewanella marisflavi]MCL1041841.1 glutamate 5-kinase [Shewanella marisflavi]QDF74412.1 glutamate 5-kinase [Shewanella marisflavi]
MANIHWKRIVVKVGSALIAPHKQGCSSHYLLGIAQFIANCRAQGVQVVLVSSGSVAAGWHRLGNVDQPSVSQKKAMAAAGQADMMATWDKLFDFPSAQLLVTHGDLRDRERYISIKNTLFSLLDHGLLPIVNENDAVTTDTLRVGDNDNLSAMVAAASDADALIICSDVKGLYTKNPQLHDDAKLIKQVTEINADIYAMAGGATSQVGTGGMRTKIEAAEKAIAHGIETVIVNGFDPDAFNQLLKGQNPGTLFTPFEQPMQEHVHWMTHTSQAQGELIVENNFDGPLDEHETQLTSDDVVAVKGNFSVGDTVLVRKGDGTKLAKAQANYSSCLLNFIAKQEDREFAHDVEQQTGPILSDKNIAILE